MYSQVEQCLRRLTDLFVPRMLIAVQCINLSIVVAMIYDDGLVEFRDRTKLELLPPDGQNQISSLSQIGFTFPQIRSCRHLVACEYD